MPTPVNVHLGSDIVAGRVTVKTSGTGPGVLVTETPGQPGELTNETGSGQGVYVQYDAFNPATLPGFLIEANIALSVANGKAWSDAGKTTPALTNGSLVRVFTDTRSGIDWVAPSNAARMTLQGNGSGLWWLVSANDNVMGYAAASGSLSGASTLAYCATETSAANNRILQSADGSSNALMDARRSGLAMYVQGTVCSGPIITDSSPHVYLASKPASGNWDSWLDGVLQARAGNVTTEWLNPAIGAGGHNGENFAGNFYGAVHCNSQVTGSNQTALQTYLLKLATG
jgi:hypothetical protein